MKAKMTVTLGIVVAGLLIAFVAWAQKSEKQTDRQGFKNHQGEQGNRKGGECRHGKEGKPGGGFHSKRMMENLSLTADQRAKVDRIVAESDKTAEPVRTETKGLRDKMRAEWQATAPNEGNLIGLHRKIHDAEGKLAEQRIATRIDIIAILTDEQRAQMGKRLAERGPKEGRGRRDGKGEGFHRHGGGFGPGPGAKEKTL